MCSHKKKGITFQDALPLSFDANVLLRTLVCCPDMPIVLLNGIEQIRVGVNLWD